MPAEATRVTRRRSQRVDLFLGLAVLALTAPFLREWSTQPASRYLFTAAVVDDHTLRIDPYRESLGADYAIIDGHVYSDKAPYQPVLTTPVYALYRAFGGEPFVRGVSGYDVGHRFDIALWLMTLWSSSLPAVLLAILMRRYVARWFPGEAVAVTLALIFGTVLLPFGGLLFGHMLAATVGFAAWVTLRRESPTPWSLLGGGVLLGAGLGVEYPQVIVALVIGTAMIISVRVRALWTVLGGALGALPLLIFNTLVFGGPFKTAYQGYLPNFQGSGAFGVYNLVAPNPREFVLAVVGDRGLFSLTPVMVLAAAGGIRAVRRKLETRLDAIVAFVLLGLFLLVSTGIDGYGGSSPGPRYLVPIIPFFVLPLAEAWRTWRPLCIITAVWSAIWMVLATLTDSLYSAGGHARADWLSNLFAGRFEHSIPGALMGAPAILLMVVVATACGFAALRFNRAPAPATATDDGCTEDPPSPAARL